MRRSLPAGPETRRRPSHLKGFLRLLPFLLAAMGLVWIALDGLIFRESARHMRDLEHVSAIHRNYRDATEAAGLLKAGSDALTQAVRRYAATGRPTFLRAYELEEHVDRHRERALKLIERMPGADDHARRMLRTSMTESLALQDVEHRAMRLVAEATDVPREEMPEHLQAVVLSPDEEALDAPGKRARAIDLLYDEAYFAAKSNIWAGVNSFLDRTIGETQDTFDDTTKSTIRSVTRQMVLFTLALAVVFGALILSASVGYAMFARMTRENLGLMDDLRRERDATLAAEKARSMFFSMVSHDIRTPLNSIIGFSEMLREGVADPKERAENIENILFSSHTLLSLVNDVLDLSKLDAEKMKFSSAPCDFPALLFRVAGTFRFQVEQKGLALRVAAAPMPRLMLDEERVRQILVNLVSNAVKFTEQGSVAISADWTPAPDGASGSLRFSVRDTGCGIAPEDQPRVLEPFVQVGQSGTGGTGLGLPICQRLLVRMGGELRLESEPGKGSTFTGLLHAVAVAPDLPSPASSASTTSTASTAPATPTDSTASTASHPVRSALVVDDVPVNLLVEKAMLQRAGVTEIVTAPSGTAALEALEKHGAFDVVLTDLWMPEMDGYALCAHLRADERWKKLPVYAVTADVEARKVAHERGFDGLLLKPVTTESLAGFLGSFRAPRA